MGGVRIVTPPVETAVTLNELKLHLRVDHSFEDTLINSINKAAERYVERTLWRQIVTATLAYDIDWRDWPGGGSWQRQSSRGIVDVPRPPLVSVTQIQYKDQAGATQTLSNTTYDVDTTHEPGRVVRKRNITWPEVDEVPNAVTITYTAGYGDADVVPETIKSAIKVLASHWFEHREAVVVGTISQEIQILLAHLLACERFDLVGMP